MFTPTFELTDTQQTVMVDGSAQLGDFVNYVNTVNGLNGLSPVASVTLVAGVITITFKDARTFVVTMRVDGTYNIACNGYYNDNEFQLLRAVGQVVAALATSNSVANLNNTFA